MTEAPTIDLDDVHITRHAIERYIGRRNTRPDAAICAIWHFVEEAATMPTPPVFVRDSSSTPVRRYVVGGFALVFTADLRTLLTVYRHTAPYKRRTGPRRRRREGVIQ